MVLRKPLPKAGNVGGFYLSILGRRGSRRRAQLLDAGELLLVVVPAPAAGRAGAGRAVRFGLPPRARQLVDIAYTAWPWPRNFWD
jgi:hypothetical protein